ncbi:MAG: helix-turn-helix domain-containing protein, partial [Dehalococcoidia bacterium]
CAPFVAVGGDTASAGLRLSRRSAYRAAAAGRIPTIRLGRRILVPTALLESMLGIAPNNAATPDAVTASANGAPEKHAPRTLGEG